MIGSIVATLFGTHNDRELKRIRNNVVAAVNALEGVMQELSDDELAGKTPAFKERLAAGESLDDLLPEAFAVCREAGRRILGMRHFDVQLIGGAALHEGKISEMRTGEGKTLVATLPVYLNALTGRGVHVVTVNDYLARRDAEWMGRLYRFLGLTVGVIVPGIDEAERRAAYAADITYATNNELGFDYLRDNMKFSLGDLVQRPLNFAIVDEVDSILVDEARTPLIISGPAEQSTEKYAQVDRIIPAVLRSEENYTVDEKAKAVMLTEPGISVAEEALGVANLYDPANVDTLHHVHQGLRAHVMYKKDIDYVVKDGKVIIVDVFTGRLMPGRRWSDGLHQAVEAKEGVKVENENQTLATITFQNFFRMYDKLGGMTGTAETEASEFSEIYGLEVLCIPTNRPNARVDHPDQVYMSVREKDDAIINEIAARHESGQPVLVGTISIEKSESLSRLLTKRKIPHNVLNAKQHEREAEIVAQAGRKGAVTIATNMAGRGTDIVLGGNPEMRARVDDDLTPDDEGYEEAVASYAGECAEEKEQVLAAGGLHIIGTERHESRRIDNQLRGRSGRQGDPGSSRFFLSLEDDLMRIFGSDRLQGLMTKLGMEEGEPIEHKMVTRAIEGAQKKVEGHNFDMRKHLLEYDDVMNRQREIIYEQRRLILDGEKLPDTVRDMAEQVLIDDLSLHTPEQATPEEWDLDGLKESMARHFGVAVEVDGEKNLTVAGCAFPFAEVVHQELAEGLLDAVEERLKNRAAQADPKVWGEVSRYLTLQIVDTNWKDHLLSMDYLKEGIGLRGYAQKNPLNEYKKEGMAMFNAMIDRVREDVVSALCHVRIESEAEARLREQQERERAAAAAKMIMTHGDAPAEEKKSEPVRRDHEKVGRNDPCPCGSGKKYKKCHGATA